MYRLWKPLHVVSEYYGQRKVKRREASKKPGQSGEENAQFELEGQRSRSCAQYLSKIKL